ncbi:MAG: M43 family zinc metalloprotease [Bacteroidota bacterium]
MRKLNLFLLLACLLPGFLAAQTLDRNCATTEYLELQMQQDPSLQMRMDQIERFTQDYVNEAQQSGQRVSGVISIPVVVHVVYRNTTENISDAQIQSQLDVLNEDFRRTNSDADNVWSQADDVEIEFCLATVDPSGNSTTGITRTSTRKRSFSYSNDGVKFNSSGGKDAWPAADYMNMWVCNLGSGLLGYAQFPGGAAATDGIVIDYAYFGNTGTATFPYDLGRTATHEVGHYLGLRHIWGDGPCGVDDFVSDTPESDASNGGCAIGHVSCGSVDMVQNYMDYSYDACMNLFTLGQGTRMRSYFDAGGSRASLLNSNGCGNGTGGDHCTNLVQDADETGVDCGGVDCPACPPTGSCDAVTGVSDSYTTKGKKNTKLNISWNAAAGANSYTVTLSGGAGSGSSTTTSTSIQLSGLTRSTAYTYTITTNCTGGSASAGPFSATSPARFDGTPSLTLYPNPAKEWVVLEFTPMEYETATVEIFDLAGRKIYRDENASTLDGYVELDISQLKSGIYLISLTDGDAGRYVQKLIVND